VSIKTHRSLEEKLQIVLAGLKGQTSIAELCGRHSHSETVFYISLRRSTRCAGSHPALDRGLWTPSGHSRGGLLSERGSVERVKEWIWTWAGFYNQAKLTLC